MSRQYSSYEKVREGLKREDGFEIDASPRFYIKYLRYETGLSYAKIAHDLSVDSGVEVSKDTVRRWEK